jgi:hypothetical protein
MDTEESEVHVVTVSGSPRERGRIHGETLRSEIREVMARWQAALQEASGLPAEKYIDRFLAETNFLPAIERRTPDLLEEVRGIAEGADLPFRDVFACQLVDEQWIYTRQLREQRELTGAEHCTAFGAFDAPGRPPILAQNMDLPKYYDGAQVLLRVEDAESGVDALILTIAGLIVTTGVNSRGVGCCCNTVSQLTSSRDGLPVAFIVRHILAQTSRADAERFVRSIRHASGQNYTIGDPGGIVSLECSATRVAAFAPLPGRVYHTNHPVVNDDLETRPDGGNTSIPDPITGRQRTNTETRFEAAAAALHDAGKVTVDTAKGILSDPTSLVCAMLESGIPSFTFGSVVMELSAPPVMHLAPGPPAVTAYQTWAFA